MEILLAIVIVAVIGIVAGVGLSLASKFFAVETPEKLTKIEEALPGANCGSCGYSGCSGYAEAIFKGEAEPNKCTVGGKKTAEELSEILGVEMEIKQYKAYVACNGQIGVANTKHAYSGIQSCSAALKFYGGEKECEYACLGYGDCVNVCKFGALKIVNGVAVVDEDLCVGCGACQNTCPKKVISLKEEGKKTYVACSNKNKGAVANKQCTSSCIGCMKCTKVCPENAITVTDFLAKIDSTKCTSCGKCAEECPKKCIVFNCG